MEKKKRKRGWLWAALGVVAIVVIFIVFGKKKGSKYEINSDVATVETITQSVTATGVVQPVYKVTVGTQVSGIVERLYVDYNSHVRQGQLLAELDKSLLQDNVNISRSNLSVSTSQKDLAQKQFDRIAALYAKQAATQQEYDQAEANLDQATNQLVTAQANYDNALTQLRYAEIHSPIDGIVISKQVEEGQTVQGAYSVPNLFTIAKNLTEIQVEAKVDEADIGQVRNGQQVTFKVDAYPGEKFHGTVSQIRMEPQVNNNVVTYVVIISARNPDEKLFPGMTASVSIIVQSDNGLSIPIYATQLHPDKQTVAELEQQGYTLDSSASTDPKETFIWTKSGKQLTLRRVTLGSKTRLKAIVTEGLDAGDTVVSAIVDFERQKAERGDGVLVF